MVLCWFVYIYYIYTMLASEVRSRGGDKLGTTVRKQWNVLVVVDQGFLPKACDVATSLKLSTYRSQVKVWRSQYTTLSSPEEKHDISIINNNPNNITLQW